MVFLKSLGLCFLPLSLHSRTHSSTLTVAPAFVRSPLLPVQQQPSQFDIFVGEQLSLVFLGFDSPSLFTIHSRATPSPLLPSSINGKTLCECETLAGSLVAADIPHARRVSSVKSNSAPIFGSFVAFSKTSPPLARFQLALDGLPCPAPLYSTAPYLAFVGFIPQRLNCSPRQTTLCFSSSLSSLSPTSFHQLRLNLSHARTYSHVGRRIEDYVLKDWRRR